MFCKNFFSFLKLKIMIDETKYIWISNYQIHEEAKLDINDFLEKINCTEGLRVASWFRFTLFPTDKMEYDTNLELWDYINKNRNALNEKNKFYCIQFPKNLYYFLKHTKKSDIMKPIIIGLAGHYILEPSKRKILEKQIYKPIFNQVLEVVNKYFSDYLNLDFKTSYDDDGEETNESEIATQSFRDKFHEVYGKYAKNSIMYQLVNPYDNIEKYNLASFEDDFDIKLNHAFMTYIDWDSIVINGEKDSLDRSESKKEPLMRWRNDILRHHKNLDLQKFYERV